MNLLNFRDYRNPFETWADKFKPSGDATVAQIEEYLSLQVTSALTVVDESSGVVTIPTGIANRTSVVKATDRVARHFNLTVYPTTLFFWKGKETGRYVGEISAPDFISHYRQHVLVPRIYHPNPVPKEFKP